MSDTTFKFIKTLSKKEKIHFKRYSRIHSDKKQKNYLRLYEFLESEKDYDEKNIKKAFKGESLSKYLSSEQNYLLLQMLNSIAVLNTQASNYRKLVKTILYIDVLFEKGLREKATKMLKKAKLMANQFEEFSIVLELIEMEENILFKHGILNFTKKLNELKEERERVTAKIQNFNTLRLLKEQVRELQYVEDFLVHPKKYDPILNHELILDKDKVISLKGLDIWYYLQGLKHYLLRDYEHSYQYMQQQFHFFFQNQYLFRNPQKMPVISNFMFLSAKVVNKENFDLALKELMKMEDVKDVDSVYVYYIKYARTLELHFQDKSLEECIDFLPACSQYIQSNRHLIGATELDHIVVLMARTFLTLKDYENALEWVNFWHKTEGIKISLNLIRVFTLLIYFELGYHNLLQSNADSFYKYLKNKKKILFEKTILAFLKKAMSFSNDKKKLSKGFSKFKKQLLEIKKDSKENHSFEFFDFIEWADGHVT